MVLLTTFRNVDFAIDPREMVVRRLSILGSRYVSKSEIVEAAALVEAGHVRPIVTQVVPPEGVQEVHHALQEGTLVGRGALLW
jgi:D-arabinose 1-dehydrogenase-like Zn-dependent alcohol dehydrogenase